MGSLPDHVAIIMDGNGRWAAERGLKRTAGHRAGARSLRNIIEECVRLQIPYLTVFAFSTENWRRPRDEVDNLMALMAEFSRSEAEELRNAGVRVIPVGCTEALSPVAREGIETLSRMTFDGDGLVLLLAVNYGGRADLARAARRVAEGCLRGEIDPADIDESCLRRYLHSYPYPDPDLIIRTGGERRLSNFYLYQAAYAELYACDVYWPDFGPEDLGVALRAYQARSRRFGGSADSSREGR